MESIRINKYISMCGICSRREADRLIEQGLVTIDGRTAGCGDKVADGQEVKVRGRKAEIISGDSLKVYALNKPVGIISSMSDEQGEGLQRFVGKTGLRLYPVGRLDKDSQGLVLLTNDGALAKGIMKAGEGHEKEYIVSVDNEITEEDLKALESGVMIYNKATDDMVRTVPCRCKRISRYTFSIVLIQGLNRQIRRMCESLGYSVVTLTRTRIMNIRLENLQSGEMREITGSELDELRKSVRSNG